MAWIDVCWVVVVDEGNGPESGGKVSGVMRIPNRNWFLVQMGVALCDKSCLLHLLLPDNKGILHQLLLVFMEDFSWRIRSHVLSD